MKRLLVLCLLFVSLNSYSQNVNKHGLYHVPDHALALNASSGLSYYFGDAEIDWVLSRHSKAQANYFVEASLSYSYWGYFSVRANLIHAKLSGTRASYSFSSTLFEPDIMVEYHPFSLSAEWDLYGFTGFGLVFSSVKAYDIAYSFGRDLSFTTPTIPAGLGLKYNFENGFQLGANFAFRFALYDRESNSFDGFPYTYNGNILRGATSRFVDIYYTLGITLGYQWYF